MPSAIIGVAPLPHRPSDALLARRRKQVEHAGADQRSVENVSGPDQAFELGGEQAGIARTYADQPDVPDDLIILRRS